MSMEQDTPPVTPQPDEFADMEKWAMGAGKVLVGLFGAMAGVMILATGTAFVQGILSMPVQEKINIAKDTLDALPAQLE